MKDKDSEVTDYDSKVYVTSNYNPDPLKSYDGLDLKPNCGNGLMFPR